MTTETAAKPSKRARKAAAAKKPKPPTVPQTHGEAKVADCDRCGAVIWVGMTGPFLAEQVRVDPPLGPASDPAVLLRAVVAHLSGRVVVGADNTTRRLHDLDWPDAGVPRGRLCLTHTCPTPPIP